MSGLTLSAAGQYYARVMGTTADSVQLYDLLLSLAATTVPGDFNHDSAVNAADYVTWRKNDGTQAGYATWRQNFGTTSPGSGALLAASVPEPTSAMLLAFGAAVVPYRRRRNSLRVRRC